MHLARDMVIVGGGVGGSPLTSKSRSPSNSDLMTTSWPTKFTSTIGLDSASVARGFRMHPTV
eukprot:2019627-Pyramimonas_sp.AAC.1